MLTFFGLGERYSEAVYEQMFLLKYYGGWSFFEAYKLPISVRNWMIDRLVKQKEEESKAMNSANKKTPTQSSFKL